MLLDNSFEHLGSTGVVTNSFRIDYGNWPLRADPQAIGFRPINQWLRTNELQFFQPGFQIFPGREALFFGRTFRLSLIRAKKYVPAVLGQTKPRRDPLQFEIRSHGGNFKVYLY